MGTLYKVVALSVLLPIAAVGQDPTATQQACNDGDPDACHEVGAMFESGQGVERDPMRASIYYERACNGGAMQACAALGMMHLRGGGVTMDRRRAVALLERACDGDEGSACATLGLQYANGRTLEQDLERAAELLGRACDLNDLGGCANLGVLYQQGAGVEADSARAVVLFRTACQAGQPDACSLLTNGNWQLGLTGAAPAGTTTTSTPTAATLRARSAAGSPAILIISCSLDRVQVTIQWLGRLSDQELDLTTTVGTTATPAEAWSFDEEARQHTYAEDASAFLEELVRQEAQTFFASAEAASASFAVAGLSELMIPFSRTCGL